MTTIRLKFRSSKIGEGRLYYQVVHDRKARVINTSYTILDSEWDEEQSALRFSGNRERRNAIITIRCKIRKDLERFSRIDNKLKDSGYSYSVDDFKMEYKEYLSCYSLYNYMTELISRMKRNGQMRTAETYCSTLNSFMHFRHNQDVVLDSISAEMMEEYETWLKGRGVVLNTVSFYTRILRAVYNRAVGEGAFENCYPFRTVYTGIAKTKKRAISLKYISKIKKLNLCNEPMLDYARDMFMLSFYLRGMSFIDMAFLRKTNLRDGFISYRRRKTGQQLTIKWTYEMQKILDKYPENETDYLLPIIRTRKTGERSIYHNACYSINRSLKKIAKQLRIPIPLTLYVARHSWATAARDKGIPLCIISDGLGHDSEATTKIYLSSIATAAVDRANHIIISSL